MIEAPSRSPTSCAAHGLATGPDGRCVICRRNRRASGSDGGRGALKALALLAAAVVGAVALKYARPAASSEAAASAEPPNGAAVGADDAPRSPRAEIGGPRGPDQTRPRRDAPREAPGRLEAPSPSAAPSSPGPSPEDARARAAELAAAMERVPIRMFTTAWCPACRQARAHLVEKRISFVEIDVEASPAARREHRTRNPRGSVPTLDVDGEVLVGFAPSQLQAAMRRAAERRLDRP